MLQGSLAALGISETSSPIVKLRPMIRIRMRPALAVLLPQLLLFRRQQRPVVERVQLLGDSNERRRFALTDIRTDFDYFSQATAKIVAPMAKIKLGAYIDHIARAQFRHATGGARILNFSETDFTGAGCFSSRESTASFGALILFRHAIS